MSQAYNIPPAAAGKRERRCDLSRVRGHGQSELLLLLAFLMSEVEITSVCAWHVKRLVNSRVNRGKTRVKLVVLLLFMPDRRFISTPTMS